jgi:hypothetical protein
MLVLRFAAFGGGTCGATVDSGASGTSGSPVPAEDSSPAPLKDSEGHHRRKEVAASQLSTWPSAMLTAGVELKCSKPCFDCIQLLKKHGIKKIYYSTEYSTIVCEKLNHIQNRSSSGRK